MFGKTVEGMSHKQLAEVHNRNIKEIKKELEKNIVGILFWTYTNEL